MAIKTLSENGNFLLKNQTTNDTNPDGYLNDGQKRMIAIWGTFGSGTVNLQGSPDGGTTWIDLELSAGTPAQYTTNKINELRIWPKGMAFRAQLSFATTPDISVKVF